MIFLFLKLFKILLSLRRNKIVWSSFIGTGIAERNKKSTVAKFLEFFRQVVVQKSCSKAHQSSRKICIFNSFFYSKKWTNILTVSKLSSEINYYLFLKLFKIEIKALFALSEVCELFSYTTFFAWKN